MNDANELIPTRKSLLSRLKNRDDQESWRDFFETYWRLIYKTALRAGLNEPEAEDVVQETVLSAFKNIPAFKYDSDQASFKTWLLRLTKWRILDQFEKRQPLIARPRRRAETSTGTDTLEGLADSMPPELEVLWDKEWEDNLMQAALERVKRKVDSKAYQIFDLLTFKQWPVPRVAKALKVPSAYVYLTRHRVTSLMRKEVNDLKDKPMCPFRSNRKLKQ